MKSSCLRCRPTGKESEYFPLRSRHKWPWSITRAFKRANQTSRDRTTDSDTKVSRLLYIVVLWTGFDFSLLLQVALQEKEIDGAVVIRVARPCHLRRTCLLFFYPLLNEHVKSYYVVQIVRQTPCEKRLSLCRPDKMVWKINYKHYTVWLRVVCCNSSNSIMSCTVRFRLSPAVKVDDDARTGRK